MSDSKPGVKSTELWMMVAAQVAATIVLIHENVDLGGWGKAAVIIAQILGAIGYGAVRATVKKADVQLQSAKMHLEAVEKAKLLVPQSAKPQGL